MYGSITVGRDYITVHSISAIYILVYTSSTDVTPPLCTLDDELVFIAYVNHVYMYMYLLSNFKLFSYKKQSGIKNHIQVDFTKKN